MVVSATSAAFCDAALIRLRTLLEGDAYSDLSVGDAAFIRGRRLFETQQLLKEIQYLTIFRMRTFEELRYPL